jgi:hypothetical protein
VLQRTVSRHRVLDPGVLRTKLAELERVAEGSAFVPQALALEYERATAEADGIEREQQAERAAA